MKASIFVVGVNGPLMTPGFDSTEHDSLSAALSALSERVRDYARMLSPINAEALMEAFSQACENVIDTTDVLDFDFDEMLFYLEPYPC